MNKGVLFFVVLSLVFSNINYVDATVAPSPYAMVDYSDQSGSVDLATGDMSLSLPVMSVPGIDGGLSYPIGLNYRAGIKIDQQPSWVGLGWGLNLPTITRTVVGVPDDYAGESNNVRVYDQRKHFTNTYVKEKHSQWFSFFRGVGVSVLSAALAAQTGGVSFLGTFGTSQGIQTIGGGGIINGPATYADYDIEELAFDSVERNFDATGFFYLDETYAGKEEYVLESNAPDSFSVNSPIYSGGLTYGRFAPLSTNVVSSGGKYICMLPTDGIGFSQDTSSNLDTQDILNYCDNPLGAKFILNGEEFNEIELVSPDGVRYTFEPITKVVNSIVKQTKFPVLDNTEVTQEQNCEKIWSSTEEWNYMETEFNPNRNVASEYVLVWGLSKISSTRNTNDYIEFKYSNYVARTSANPAASEEGAGCSVLPDGRISYTIVETETKTLESIESPTHYVNFNLGEQFPNSDIISGEPKYRLSNIELYYSGVDGIIYSLDDEKLSEFKFNYANYQNSLRAGNALTLESFEACGLNGACMPRTKFEYGFDPIAGVNSFYSWDRWKYYYNVPGGILGGHNKDNAPTGIDSSAWSLTKVFWPSGGTTEWIYEQDRFNYVGKQEYDTQYGGGIRVDNIINCESLSGVCYTMDYEYDLGAVDAMPGSYAGLNYRDTYAKQSYSAPVLYGEVKVYPEGANGYILNSFTTAKDFPDRGPYIPPKLVEKESVNGNVYTYGLSIPQDSSRFYNIPIDEEFLVIGPAEDTIAFYIGYFRESFDCVYSVDLPTKLESNCNFEGLDYAGSDELVCKTVKIDRCNAPGGNKFYEYNDVANGYNNGICGPDHMCSFMVSKKVSGGPGSLVIPSNREQVIFSLKHGLLAGPFNDLIFNNPIFDQFEKNKYLGCQDVNLDNVCDIEEIPEEQRLDFGGIDFGKFRGLSLEKNVFAEDGSLISKSENVYRGLDGAFDINGGNINTGSNYFGYDISGDEGQGFFKYLRAGNNRMTSFLPSIWITLQKTINIIDGKVVETDFEYADNGLPIKVSSTNSNGAQLISITDYVGDFGDDCNDGNAKLRRDSAGNDYHVWTATLKNSIKNGVGAHNFMSEMRNTYDSSDKCYVKENYAWREDLINEGAPDFDAGEFGTYVSQISNRIGIYDRATAVKDSLGNEVKSFYMISGENCDGDTDGSKLTCVEDSMGNQVRYYYDNYGRLEYTKDTNGVITYYEYDDLHRLKRVYDSVSDSEIITDYNYGLSNCDALEIGNENCMNWVGTKIRIKDGLYSETRTYADGLGRHMQSSAIKGDNLAIVTDTLYNSRGLIKEVTKPYSIGGGIVQDLLNDIGLIGSDYLLSYHEDGANKEGSDENLKYYYYGDPLARQWKTYPSGVAFDENDLNQACDKYGFCTEYFYGLAESNSLYTYDKIVDAENNYVITKTDKFGKVVEVEDSLGNIATIDYDVLGNVIDSTDAKGRDANLAGDNFVYNVLGQLKKQYELNSGDSEYAYDKVGNVKSVTTAIETLDEKTFLNEYDDLYRLVRNCEDSNNNGVCGVNEILSENYYDEIPTEINVLGGSCVEGGPSIGFLCAVIDRVQGTWIQYTYDRKGNIIEMVNHVGVTNYGYSYEYDDAGNLIKMVLPNYEVVEYNYNSLNQLETVSIDGILQDFVFNYDEMGKIDLINYPDQSYQNFSYNERNWISSIDIKDINGISIFKEAYMEYDNVGNLKKMENLLDGNYVTFDYDGLYRLESFSNFGNYYDESSNGFIGLDSISYNYDNVGNRLSRIVSGEGGEIVNTVLDYLYGTDDQLDSADGCSYTYNGLGALKNKVCSAVITNYYYDKNNRLSEIDILGDHKLKFGYDAFGRRVWKSYLSEGETMPVYTVYTYGIGMNPDLVIEPYYCLGDINQDGIVGLADTILFVPMYVSGEYYEEIDFFREQDVDRINLADLVIYAGNINLNTEQCVMGITSEEQLALHQEGCRDICTSGNTQVRNSGICECSSPPQRLPDLQQV